MEAYNKSRAVVYCNMVKMTYKNKHFFCVLPDFYRNKLKLNFIR